MITTKNERKTKLKLKPAKYHCDKEKYVSDRTAYRGKKRAP
jgi:hypothetical protein